MIDVRLALDEVRHDDELVVVSEPTYGCVAVAAALDAGWGSVEVAPLALAPDRTPIPLVSFEQPAPRADEQRCRVRSDDLASTLDRAVGSSRVLLAAPVNARPAASVIARAVAPHARVTFVPAQRVRPGGAEPLTSDGFWAVGMLIRVLLEELDEPRGTCLGDAAGLAVSIARGAEGAASQLVAGGRWRDHLAAGGHPDDLRIASAVDSIGSVPVVEREDGELVARAWRAEALSSADDA